MEFSRAVCQLIVIVFTEHINHGLRPVLVLYQQSMARRGFPPGKARGVNHLAAEAERLPSRFSLIQDLWRTRPINVNHQDLFKDPCEVILAFRDDCPSCYLDMSKSFNQT